MNDVLYILISAAKLNVYFICNHHTDLKGWSDLVGFRTGVYGLDIQGVGFPRPRLTLFLD